MYRDVVDVVEQAGERLDMIMMPKVGTSADVYLPTRVLAHLQDLLMSSVQLLRLE